MKLGEKEPYRKPKMTLQYKAERVENKYCYSKELLCDKTLPQLCDETGKMYP